LSRFASHVRRFGSIPTYSTDIGELAHKEQIKEGYRRSNKNEAARQILSHYGCQHALGMRLQTTKELSKTDDKIRIGNVRTEMATSTTYSVPRRIHCSHAMNSNTLIELARVLKIGYSDMIEEMLRYIKQTTADEQRLTTNTTELRFLPIEPFTQLEIPVPDFQETGVFRIHRARCTGKNSFRNAGPRNDLIWIRACGEDTSRVL